MSEPRSCPSCGAPLPADAPDGMCPKCLLQLGFESQAGPASESDPARSPTFYQPGSLPPTIEELAARFPQLELLEQIGQGGMGVVYKARQKELDRIVALKLLRPDIESDPAFAERFVREARALARLSHPAIVTVHDFGRTDGFYYFVMEYVEGANLRELERSGKLTPQEALAIVPQICEALQYAHDRGVVHRDIKPENVLIDKEGRVKIADFGLAKMVGAVPDSATLTGAWQVMGTPHYMAPEQMQGAHSVDHRADIYSLGVVIYEMLTGELPLGRFALPSERVHVDVRLDEVVLRALEREPERRYQQASEVKTEIETISRDPTIAPTGSRDGIDRAAAAEELKVAVIGLWIAGGVELVAALSLVGVAVALLASMADPLKLMLPMLVVGIPSLLFGSLSVATAHRLRNLNNYFAVLYGCILCVLPLSVGWILRVVFAALALMSLRRPEIKAAFNASSAAAAPRAREERPPPRANDAGMEIENISSAASREASTARGTREERDQKSARQVLRGLAWLLVCVNVVVLVIGALFIGQHGGGGFAVSAEPVPLERAVKELVWIDLAYVFRAAVFFLLPALALSVCCYHLAHSYLEAQHGPLIDANDPAAVRRLVRRPAVGLVASGIATWVGLPLVVLAMLPPMFAPAAIAVTASLLFLAGGLLIAAGLTMARLQAYPLAVLGSLLALVAVPGNVIGVPMGVWALCLLMHREVKAAFRTRSGSETNRDEDNSPHPGNPAAPRRPFIVTLLALTCLLIGLWNLFVAALTLALPVSTEDELHALMMDRPALRTWHAIQATAESWLEFPLAYALLAAGVGLLMVRPWGRWLASGWAVVNLVLGLALLPVMFAGMTLMLQSPDLAAEGETEPVVPVLLAAFLGMLVVIALDVVFPIVVLLALNRPRVKAAFAARRSHGPDEAEASTDGTSGLVVRTRATLGGFGKSCVKRYPGPTRIALLAIYLVAFVLFFGSRGSGGPGRMEYTIGVPFAWYEYNMETGVGGHMRVLLLTPAWLLMAAALAAVWLGLRVRQRDVPVSVWELPSTHAVLWWLAALGGVLWGYVASALTAEAGPDLAFAFSVIGGWTAALVGSIVWLYRVRRRLREGSGDGAADAGRGSPHG